MEVQDRDTDRAAGEQGGTPSLPCFIFALGQYSQTAIFLSQNESRTSLLGSTNFRRDSLLITKPVTTDMHLCGLCTGKGFEGLEGNTLPNLEADASRQQFSHSQLTYCKAKLSYRNMCRRRNAAWQRVLLY